MTVLKVNFLRHLSPAYDIKTNKNTACMYLPEEWEVGVRKQMRKISLRPTVGKRRLFFPLVT